MKKYLTPLFTCCLLGLFVSNGSAQNSTVRTDKLYTMSSAGFSFPVGETADYLKPKFSTSLGLNLGLGKSGLFLYPQVSLHAYGFKELTPDAGYSYALQKARATTYLLNVALGYRWMSGKFAYYTFAGGGGGLILTQRIIVNPSTAQATLNSKNNSMAIIEGGAGVEYNVGGAVLFIEAGYMHGFSEIQNRSFNTVPIGVGIKPNLSKWFKK